MDERHFTPPAHPPGTLDRAGLVGLVYLTTDGKVDRDAPLPIEVVDAAPEATLDAINAEADREARLAARRFEREGEALAVEVVADRPAGIPDHDSTNSSGVPVRAIVSTSMDTPLSPHERASIARLLEATVEALGNERATHAMNAQAFTTHLRWIADRAALAVRQGHRAHLLDQLTADLDTFIASLSQP